MAQGMHQHEPSSIQHHFIKVQIQGNRHFETSNLHVGNVPVQDGRYPMELVYLGTLRKTMTPPDPLYTTRGPDSNGNVRALGALLPGQPSATKELPPRR